MTQLTLQEKMYALAADRALFEQAKASAFDFLDGVFDRSPFPTTTALAGLAAYDEPLPPEPGDPAEMLRLLHEHGSPSTVATVGGRYYGMVIGSVFPPVMAVKWLADVWDQLAALHVTSPLMGKVESR